MQGVAGPQHGQDDWWHQSGPRVGVLGPMRAVSDTGSTDIGTDIPGRLVALLVAAGPNGASIERLIEELWGARPPTTARTSLRNAASRARRSTGVGIDAGDGRYRLDPHTGVDAWAFIDRIQAGRAPDALALWRGRPYPDIDTSLTDDSAAELTRYLCHAYSEAASVDDPAVGRPDLVRTVDGELQIDPYRPALAVALAIARYREDGQVAALAALRRSIDAIRSDTGLEPEPLLLEAELAVLDQDPARLAAPLRSVVAPAERGATLGQVARALADTRTHQLIGRTPELERLVSHVEAMAADERTTPVAVVRGAPGMGKTWLLAALADRAAAAGADVLYGRNDESGFVPFQPWTEILWSIHDHGDHDRLATTLGPLSSAISRLCPGFAGIDTDTAEVPDPDTERSRLFEAIARIIDAQASVRPQVLVVDDLQWSEAASTSLLRHVLTRLRSKRVLILAAARPALTVHDVDALTILGDPWASHADVIELGGIDLAAARVLASQVRAGSSDLPVGTVERLHHRSGGSPLHLNQLVRAVGADGRLPFADELIQVPAEHAASMGARSAVARMPDDTVEFMAVAAVVGIEFAPELVAATARTSIDAAIDHIDIASRHGIVRTVGAGEQVVFVHVAFRDALYLHLSELRRREYHRRIADDLRRDTGAPPTIAYHSLAAAGSVATEVLIQDALAAADWLRDRGSFESALDVLDRVHDRVGTDALDARSRAEIGRRSSRLHMLAKDTSAARKASEAAIEAALRAGDPELYAHIAIELDDYGRNMSASTRRFELLDDAIARLQAHPGADPLLALQVRAERINEGFFFGRTRIGAEAESLRREAVAVLVDADRTGDDRTIAAALNARHMSLLSEAPSISSADPLDRASQSRLTLSTELIERARTLGDPVMAGIALQCHLHDLWQEGLFDEAEQMVHAIEDLGETTMLPKVRWFAHMMRATASYLGNDHATVEASMSAALELGTEHGLDDALPANLGARICLGLNGNGTAPLIDESAALLALSPVPEWQVAHALCLADTGRIDDARRALRSVLAQFGQWPRNVLWQMNLGWTAELVARIGADPDDLVGLRSELERYRGRFIVVGAVVFVLGPADLYCGLVAEAMDDRDTAQACFRTAREMSTRAGVASWIDRVDRALAGSR